MAHTSAPDLLILHAVRLKGFADTDVLARRFDLEPETTQAALKDYVANGWIRSSSFGDLSGWSLTEDGRRVNEAQLRDELDGITKREEIVRLHDAFLPHNATVTAACSAVQLNPSPATYDQAWEQLSGVAAALRVLEDELTACLTRFTGYHRRFNLALFRADEDPGWLTGTDLDSSHRVWFELHEDLIATLGITR